MNAKVFEAEFKRKFEDELAKALGSEVEEELPLTSDGKILGTKITCDAIDGIPQHRILVFGEENIKKIRDLELSGRLKSPPIYFAQNECRDFKAKYGIHEDGVYTLKKGAEKAKKWGDKKRGSSPRSEFMSKCLSDKSKGNTAPDRMRACSEEWKKK